VHVSNLSFKIHDEQELRSLFEKNYGEVKRVHLVKDEATGRMKGFAFVEFIDREGMQRAVRDKQVMIRDRMAIIKKSTRQITADLKESEEARKTKKREKKGERKSKIVASIIDEAMADELPKPTAVPAEPAKTEAVPEDTFKESSDKPKPENTTQEVKPP